MNSVTRTRFDWVQWVGLALLALIGAALCIKQGAHLMWPDENIYVGIVERLNQMHSFTDESGQVSAFRPPGFPYFLYLLSQLSSNILFYKLCNAALLVLTAMLACKTLARHSQLASLAAPWLLMVSPIVLYSSTILVPQTLGALLLLACIHLLTGKHLGIFSAALAGLAMGALILTIPASVLVFALVAGLLLIKWWVQGRQGFPALTAFVLATVLSVAPWVVRSSVLFDDFVFVSSNSGINLLYANSENARYNTGVVDVSAHEPPPGLNEVESDRHFKQAAMTWVREHPTDAAVLYLQKALNYFHYKNKTDTPGEESTLRNMAVFVTYYPLLAVVLVRLLFFRRYPLSWFEVLTYSVYFLNAFFAAIAYTRIRYRVPFDALLACMAALAVVKVAWPAQWKARLNLE
jgi:hypothetical protein